MKTGLLHVLGGGEWQVPTVRVAKQLGYRVLVTDSHGDLPAYALADHHALADITDREATLRVAEQFRINGIVCDSTDDGVASAAYVAEALGLAGIGFEASLNFTDKARMRARTEAAGCDTPKYALVHDVTQLREAAEKLGFPLVIKPLDSQAGRGVSRVDREEDLYEARLNALRNSRRECVLAEAWIEGVEYVVDGFVRAGEPIVLGVARKTPNKQNPTLSDHITYHPSYLEPVWDQLEAVNRRVLAALGLTGGVFHAEYKVRGSEIFPIDVAARGGGVMIYTHVLPHISGVEVNRKVIKFALGETPAIRRSLDRAANIEFFWAPYGTVQGIEGVDRARAVPGVLSVHLNIEAGSKIGRAQEKDDRSGFVVAVADSPEQATQRTAAALAHLRITMSAAY